MSTAKDLEKFVTSVRSRTDDMTDRLQRMFDEIHQIQAQLSAISEDIRDYLGSWENPDAEN